MGKKYEITNEEHFNSPFLHRIRALKSFGDVKEGDIGGYIEDEGNLSQEGDSWVYDDACVMWGAKVSGDAAVREDAIIANNSMVSDNATVSGDARVYDSKIYDNSAVYDNATAYKSEISGSSKVHGDAYIENRHISGSTEISNAEKYELTDETMEYKGRTLHRIRALRSFDDVKKGDLGGFVESDSSLYCGEHHGLSHKGNAWVYDNAKIMDQAVVAGNAKILNDAEVYDEAKVYHDARVFGHAQVFGSATVRNVAQVFDHAKVFKEAYVEADQKVNGNEEFTHGVDFSDNEVYSIEEQTDINEKNPTEENKPEDVNDKEKIQEDSVQENPTEKDPNISYAAEEDKEKVVVYDKYSAKKRDEEFKKTCTAYVNNEKIEHGSVVICNNGDIMYLEYVDNDLKTDEAYKIYPTNEVPKYAQSLKMTDEKFSGYSVVLDKKYTLNKSSIKNVLGETSTGFSNHVFSAVEYLNDRHLIKDCSTPFQKIRHAVGIYNDLSL